ncbi:MAG: hypothetical protein AB7K71_23960 [Polyangiaceae bacterium]
MVADAFPRPEPGDPEELSWALQTAHNMWSQGDAREAVRWLQRAALTATEIGMNQRGQSIAQLATHLRSTTRSQPPGTPAAAQAPQLTPTPQRPPTAQPPSRPLDRTSVSQGADPAPAAAPQHAGHAAVIAGAAARHALRVCFVKNQDGSFHVIPLAEGEASRTGMREALLVELIPGSFG